MKQIAIIALLTLAVGAPPAQSTDTAGMRVVAELLSDVNKSETALLVEVLEDIRLDGEIILETRDGQDHESAEVEHVYDNYVILKRPLKKSFLKGSKVFQR